MSPEIDDGNGKFDPWNEPETFTCPVCGRHVLRIPPSPDRDRRCFECIEDEEILDAGVPRLPEP